MTPSTTALQRLKTQRDQLNIRIQQHEARDKARARRQKLQRQILVGSYILEQAHQNGTYAALVAQLEGYLTRANDRQLFDLPARESGPIASSLSGGNNDGGTGHSDQHDPGRA